MITDIQHKNAKPKDKDYTIKVDRGLSLLVKKSDSKLWRFRYSFYSKRCLISVGQYPQVTIRQARNTLQEYLDMLADGINTSTHKKEKLGEKTFQEVVMNGIRKNTKIRVSDIAN